MESREYLTSRPDIGWLGRGWKWLRHRRWLALFVLLPTALTALYYAFFAADIYISEARFVIKAPGQKQGQISSLASLIQTTGLSGGQEQTNEVLDYIRSRDALAALAKRTDIRRRFMSPQADALSRYPAPFVADRTENLYKYYRTMVSADLDHDTGAAVLRVKGFTPDDAQALNERLLDLSEALVNRLNSRAQTKAIAEAERRVIDSEGRLRQARVSLGAYRNTTALLDPEKQGAGVLNISDRLVAEQASLRAQLETIQRVTPRNPGIASLRSRISAIGAQIAVQTGRAVGTQGGIASKLSQYENLSVEQEFATQMVTAANANLEQARTEAQRQQFYLERVVEPNRPDAALLPHRIRTVFVVFGTAACIYMISWMLIVGILEHAPED